MKITKIETIQAPEHPRILWVRIHTDEGIIGLGETYVHAEPARAVIETIYAREFLLGKDPLQIELIWRTIFDRVNYVGWGGAEIRALSAIDIALWDILGQVAGLPIYQLIGGKSQEKIRVYNTCGGEPGLDFRTNPVDYANSLLAMGITAMKIWPFDLLAKESGGHFLSASDLHKGIEPVRQIRESLGDGMDIALEFHGHWDLPNAIKIARALEEFKPMWLEDIIQVDNLQSLRQLADKVSIPLAISERLYTRYQFLPMLQLGVAQVINPDVEWCGGITEVVKIAALADTFKIPVSLHNYGGPLLNVVAAHVMSSISNTMILETGRDLLSLWKNGILKAPIQIENGYMLLPEGSGLGNRLSEDFLARPNLNVQILE